LVAGVAVGVALARPGVSSAAGSTAAPVAASDCQAGSLHLRVVGTDTGLGTTLMTVAVDSDSTATCTVAGNPALVPLDAQGRPAQVKVATGTAGVAAAAAPVAVSAASEASFVLSYRQFDPTTGAPCAALRGLQVTLPGVAGTFTLAAQLSPCGTVSVSALRAGAVQE
jgi:hypothetical protein